MDEDPKRWKVIVDATMLQRLMETMRDWKWVRVCTGILSQRLCGYGVGIFRDADGSEVVLEELSEWIEWIDINTGPFIAEAIAHLACIGFVVYDTDALTGKVWVVDPREVEIMMHLKVGEPTKYSVRHRMDMWGGAAGGDRSSARREYRICVLDEPEHMTGFPTGLLMSLFEEYDATKILIRNLQQRDTQNALTLFGLQTVPKTAQHLTAGVADARMFRSARGMPIGGHAAGLDEIVDAHAEVRESLYLHNMQFVRNLEGRDPTHLGGIAGRVAVADYDAGKIAAYTPPPDTTLVQKAFAPEFRGFVTTLLHFERSLFCTFGVPFSVVERHTGNHSNAIDLERELMSQSVSRYVNHVNMMLCDIGRTIFGCDGECRLRLRTGLSEQRLLRLYTSGLYSHAGVVEYYVKNFKEVPWHFETVDRRFDDGSGGGSSSSSGKKDKYHGHPERKAAELEKETRAGHQKSRDETSSSEQ